MRRLLSLLSISALVACSNEIDQSTRPENVAGTYQLVSYGGSALPARVRSDSVTQDVTSGRLVLASDGTWSDTLSIKTTVRGQSQTAPFVSGGTWSLLREFAYLTFNDKVNGYRFTGTASGGDVVLETVSGRLLVYRR